MKQIALFYHCRLSGGAHDAVEISPGNVTRANPPIDSVHAKNVIVEQLLALKKSGLMSVAEAVTIGCNGNESDGDWIQELAGEKAKIFVHGESSYGELPTMKLLSYWAKTHQDWFVLYQHSKGVCWPPPDDVFRRDWRRCLTWALVWNWQTCVSDLENGCDMVGGHWLTPERFPGNEHLKEPIWGGNFFWAKASYLAQLPPLSDKLEWHNRWDAEHWISKGKNPIVKDYCPHWPDPNECAKNARKIIW